LFDGGSPVDWRSARAAKILECVASPQPFFDRLGWQDNFVAHGRPECLWARWHRISPSAASTTAA